MPPYDVILEEMDRRGQFNIIHVESGSKVGFMKLTASHSPGRRFLAAIDELDVLVAQE